MKIEIVGNLTVLSTINLADSVFVANLRNQSKNNMYLSSNKLISVAEQKAWLQKYLSSKDGVYFIIKDKFSKGETGTISIYNVDLKNKKAEFGRYICFNPIHAIESELLIVSFAFHIMNLDELYCRTAINNKMVWRQHYKFGFIDDGFEETENRQMTLKRQKLTRLHFKNYDYSGLKELLNKFANL